METRCTHADERQGAMRPPRRQRSLVLWILLLLQFSAFSAMAQGGARTITGTVQDAAGEPLIGTNILIKGTSEGTTSDVDGSFTLQADAEDVLVISYTGYRTLEVPVGSQTRFTVTLEEDAQQLDEVVVIGYGQARKSDLTGAVSSVSGEDLRSTVVTNIDQALQGRVAGVQVTQNSGAPGGATSIRIRGANSITGSSEPLYVIDGIPFQGDGGTVAGFDWAGGANGQNRVNPLSTINPNDIVDIQILKDASATAIYGSQAANGVVLITTRRGKKGEAKISYNGYYANQSLPNELEMMNLRQFADYQVEIANDLDLTPNERFLDPSLLGSGTNWQNEIFRNAGMQSHQVSVSGGTEKTVYAVSGGFFQQDGIIIGSNFDRLTTRLNLDSEVKPWIKVGGSLAFADTDERITLNDGGDGVIMQALMMQPDVPVRDLNGEYAGPDVQWGASYNPVAAALQRNNTLERQRLMANIYGDATLLEGMTFRSEIGFDNNHGFNKAFHPTYRWGALINTENQLRQREENSFFWIWKNYLTYNFQFGQAHRLTAMVGTEAQRSEWNGSEVTKRNFASNDIPVLSEGDNTTSRTNGWQDAAALASYFGRFNYNLDERFLLTLTLRADGSSKFGPNNRWGYFPSGSFAWRLGQEEFMKGFTAVSDLKLRIGYGEVGNQAIGNYLWGSGMQTLDTPFGPGYRPSNISNPDLKWETTKQWNVGMDLSLYRGRVDFTFDVYDKRTEDMLLRLSIPSYLGGSNWNDIQSPYANVGSMQNRGFDLSLTTRNFDAPKFAWTTNLAFSRNRNKVLSLDNDAKIYWRNLYWYSEFQTATRTAVGQPLGLFYGYVTDGVFQDMSDIQNHAEQDNVIDGENKIGKNDGIWIGDLKFRDLNGDGVINTDDQTIIGDPNPDFTFGLNNNFTVGAFDLTVFINGSYGGDVLNYSRVVIEGQTSVFSNQAATVANRARLGLRDPLGSDTDPANVYLLNPDATMPRPTTTDNNRNNRMSDRFIEDGSYLRLQNVRLAYTLPARLTQRLRSERLRVYFNAQNLVTFTDYSGYDPEIGAFNQDPLLQSVDMGRYPTPRVFTFGLDVDF